MSQKISQDEAWNGGSTLNIKGKIQANHIHTLKLYKTSLKISKLVILLTVKNLPENTMPFPFLIGEKKTEVIKLSQSKGVKKNEWLILRYDVSFDNPTHIRGIYLAFENNNKQEVTSFHLVMLDFLFFQLGRNFHL